MNSQKLLILGTACLIIVASFVIAQSFQRAQEHSRGSLAVTILLPSSGDAYKGNDSCTIRYEITGGMPNYTVELYYAIDNQTFILINSSVNTEMAVYEYSWVTPVLTSNTVRIRVNVTDAENVTVMGLSNTFEIDSTEPSAISDLSAQATSCNTITLTWTAPGENGIPYNFTDVKDEVPDLDIPDNTQTGVTSNLTVTENIIIGSVRIYLHINHTCINQLIVKLTHPENTEATLFYMTGGTASNIWGWYEEKTFVNETDSGSPTSVDDISVFRGKNSQGTWKLFVSDNSGGYTGVIDSWKIEFTAENVMEYDIRYNSTAPIDASNWADSTQYTEKPTPSMPGRQEMFNVTGLDSGIKYYFAIKSKDNVGLNSSISNCASASALLYVNVISPNGNEIWSGKSDHKIEYEISGFKNPTELYSVNVYYLYDYVTQYIGSVNHDVAGTYEFNWTVPELNTTNMKIRVNVTAPNSTGFDESDINFTIDHDAPYVIAAPSNAFLLPTEEITIEFSESMDKTSVEEAFSIFPAVENISLVWNDNSTTLSIYHDNFTYNTRYNCSIDKTAKDISEPGNAIAGFYNFSFTAVEELSCEVLSPNGNETWNGTRPQVIQYKISGGAAPYNISFYCVNATDPGNYTVLIGYESRLNTDTYAFSWPLPGITNNTLEIKIIVADNTTPAQQTVDMSDWTFEIDSTPPGKPRPESLAADSIAKEGYPRAHAVKLKWLASGDDENIGKAMYYYIRYATQSVNETNWDDLVVIPSSQQFNYSASAESGAYDSYIISNLQPNTTYYFAVKAYDNVGFASQISDCISIKTLKWQRWPDDLEPAPEYLWDAVLQTLFLRADEELEDTEVWMKGNLKIVNDAKLTFENVMFLMDTSEDFEYSIVVAPAVYGYIEGGKFEVLYSNISARISVLEDDTEIWHPYLFLASERSRFWLMYSSMNHCGGKLEDIENPSIDIGIIHQEIDIEGRGIEVRSSDVAIENSMIADNWGIFIRTSLVTAASPTIRDNIIRHNRYGVVIKPHVSMTVQWPLNLINNVIDDNAIGVYVDTARVGLEGCMINHNIYGALYNNTPLDWPHNVSGAIYHCLFEGNTYALTATNSSLELTYTDFLNNTRIYLDGRDVSGCLYYTIYCKNTPINITNANILNNAYACWNNSTVSDTSIVTLYCEESILNISNAVISWNNGAFYQGTTIIDTKEVTSAFTTDTISTTIYHKNSLVSITNTMMASNGKPFYSESSNYIIRAIAPNGTVEEEVLVGDTDGGGTVGSEDAIFYDQDPSSTVLYHLATIYVQSSPLEFRNNIFECNLEGILCILSPYLVVDGCTMTGDGWHTTMGFISTSRLAYGVISIGAPVTFTNNKVCEYISGIVVSAGEINFTGNYFNHTLLGAVLAGSPNIPTILPAPGILFQNLWSTLENINVNASVAKNTFNYNAVGIIAGYSNLIMDDNSFVGTGWDYMAAYEGAVGVLAASSTIKMNDTAMTTLYWAGILSSEELALTFGGATLNLSFLQFANVTYGASDITITNSTLEYLLTGVQLSDSTLTVCDSTIDQCFYSIYSESSTISFKNVVIPSGWLYFGDYYGYMECDNSTVTIQDSSISLIDEMLFYKSVVSIINTDFIGNGYALISADSEVTVTGSYFEYNSKGIAVSGEESTLKVSDTGFYGNSYGIYIKGVTSTKGPYIEIIGEPGGNVFTDNQYAISCEWGVTGIIKKNEIKVSNPFYGIIIGQTARDLEIRDNSIQGGSTGIIIGDSTSKSLTVVNNTIRDCSEAGIYSASSCADIADNEISNAATGINIIYNSVLNISGNTIKSCTNGIYCDKTSTINAVENNIMSSYYGINSLSEKSPLLKGNTIVSCTYGIYNFPSGGITGNIISMNIYGIALVSSNASIYDSTISNCSYGIYSFKSSPTISNTAVIDSKLPSEYYATGAEGVDSPGGTHVGNPENVLGVPDDKYAILSDGTYLGAYGYIVEGTGAIEKVEIGCKWHTVNLVNDYMLLRYSVDGYGVTTYTDSTQHDLDVTYYLDITGDRNWTWSDSNNILIEVCHIENPGYVSYIYVDSVWLRITSSYGVYFDYSKDPSKPGAPPQLINTTVNTGNATIQDILLFNSKIDAINSSFSNIKFSDAASELRIYFYLTVSVKWQTDEPVENGTVAIWDAYQQPVFSGLTDKNGIVLIKTLVQYLNISTNRIYQPYTINASIYDLFDNKTLWVNATGTVNVWYATEYVVQQYVQLYSIQHNATIFDLINPTVSINQIPFSLTNNPLLSISGRAGDNIGIWRVQINTNNGSWADATLKVLNSMYGNYTVEWSGTLVLQEGSNYIQAIAIDTTHDNTATTAAGTIVLDTTAPSIELLSPKYNATNQSSVVLVLRITGESSETVTLYINEFAEVFSLNGTGAAVRNNTMALTEGTNAISISVSDKLGNENRMSVIIMAVDQKAPDSFIIIPAYEYVNSISEVRISATDDISGVECVKICIQKGSDYWSGSSWGTAETWLNATSSAGGYWRYSWRPSNDAEYNISTSATDRAGNTEGPHSKKFVYDATKPFIELSVPANFTTELSNITISGKTEIGANVTINSLPVYVDEDGNFNICLELGDGMNNFTIYAEDRAGNTNQTVVTIERIVKVQPPQPLSVWMFVAAGIAVAVIAGVVLVKKPKKPVRKPEKETAVKDETKEKVAETRYF